MTNRPQLKSSEPEKISVALGGGGARGIAHLGVLQALTERGLQIEHLCGISIGAIAGALFAADGNAVRVQQQIVGFLESPLFQRRRRQIFGVTPAQGYEAPNNGWLQRFRRIISARKKLLKAFRAKSVLPAAVLEQIINTLLPDARIEDLPVPFSVVAVDMLSGRRMVLDRGPLREAVRASASIPGVFPPVAWEDKLLCDIGVFETVPATTARERATGRIVAVDVSDPIVPIEECGNILEILNRMQHLAEYQLRAHSLAQADLVIRPEIGRRAWFDFTDTHALIELGYLAASRELRDFPLDSVPRNKCGVASCTCGTDGTIAPVVP